MSNAERAKRIAEIETLIDELKDKATGLADDSGFNVTYDVPAGILHKILGWRDGASGYVSELPPESAQGFPSSGDVQTWLDKVWNGPGTVHFDEQRSEQKAMLTAFAREFYPKPESAQGPRCPRCGSGELHLENNTAGVWTTCRHCGQIEPLNKAADFAQFFGPASQEVREPK